MRKFLIIFTFTSLILSFQNCAKTNLNPAEDSSSNQINTNTVDKSSVDPKIADKLDFPNQTVSQINTADHFELSLASGMIQAIGHDGSKLDQYYCLSDNELKEVKGILDTAELCQDPSQPAPDVVCTMMYKAPYALLLSQDEQVALGEMRDGCAKPVDLCGDHSDMLKGFLQNLVNNLSSKACALSEI